MRRLRWLTMMLMLLMSVSAVARDRGPSETWYTAWSSDGWMSNLWWSAGKGELLIDDTSLTFRTKAFLRGSNETSYGFKEFSRLNVRSRFMRKPVVVLTLSDKVGGDLKFVVRRSDLQFIKSKLRKYL